MIKVGVVGLGVIGRAVMNCALGGEITGADRNDPLPLDTDVLVICVGTPSKPDGACDTTDLGQVLTDLADYKGLIVSHSTAPPAFYAMHARPNLVHVPEFVRGDHAEHEYRSQKRLLIGGFSNAARRTFEIWQGLFCPMLKQYVLMTPAEAAFAKYTANVMLATKVALLNEIKPVADKFGANWSVIANALAHDKRLGTSHWKVPGPDGELGFGGACFPKDTKAFIAQGRETGHDLSILRQVLGSNIRIRGIEK